MRILDVYHPDVRAFISTKATAQKMIRDLGVQGWDVGFNAVATTWTPFQNSNNSIRVDDAFMLATSSGAKIQHHWPTQWPAEVDGDKKVKIWGDTSDASQLLDEIAQRAHDCGDPGMQFDTTINKWHTCKASGRINGSNPCLRGDAKLLTRNGEVEISKLEGQTMEVFDGEEFHPAEIWQSGVEQTLTISLSDGKKLSCTPHHTLSIVGGWTFAHRLRPGDLVRTVDGQAKVDAIDINEGNVAVFDFTMRGPRSVGIANGFVVSNCSEYKFLDDTACNLASLRLTKFLRSDGSFDVEAFTHVARTMFVAQEVLVGAASYPTERIAKNSHDFRPLGLGYCDLGAMIMRLGLPYDSDEGRGECAFVTSLLGSIAYHTSAEIARDCGGAFPGFELNRDSMREVMQLHYGAAFQMGTSDWRDQNPDRYLLAKKLWCEAKDLGLLYGFRNAQATVLAPTGSIGFALDCDTTGIEPDTALKKRKKLAGGGVVEYVNQSVQPALRRLGYEAAKIENIVNYIKKTGELPVAYEGHKSDGDRWLAPYHAPVFATAFGQPGNEVSVDGHLKMMAAAQPFLSGAISKTVNCPASYTVADIREVFVKAWKLGLKAVAVYRDGSKDQPLEAATKKTQSSVVTPQLSGVVRDEREHVVDDFWSSRDPLLPRVVFRGDAVAEMLKQRPSRRRLPVDAPSLRHKFTIAGVDGYVHLGFFNEARQDIGEIFIRMEPKAKSQIAVDLATQAASIAIQHGAHLGSLLDKWEGTEFAPSGFTGEGAEGVAWASSPLDYLAKWLRRFIEKREQDAAQGTLDVSTSPSPTSGPQQPHSAAQVLSARCPRCTASLRRDGACQSCPACGYGQGGCGG